MRRAIVALALTVAAAACGHKGKGAPANVTGTPPYDCRAHEVAAGKQLAQIADANLSCQADADCQNVALGSICSDNCTRAVNHAGVAALAGADTAGTACAGYQAAHCTLIHPPCAPPQPATCVNGACQ